MWALSATLITTIAVLLVAALLHIARYVLLIVNRTVLLNSVVAGLATGWPSQRVSRPCSRWSVRRSC